MKKTLVALVMASGMVLGSTVVASAATTVTTPPTIKKPSAAAAEGTGTHEMSETATTQKTEGVSLVKKKTVKKTVKKQTAKKIAKKIATTSVVKKKK
jgi:hypothetical protein